MNEHEKMIQEWENELTDGSPVLNKFERAFVLNLLIATQKEAYERGRIDAGIEIGMVGKDGDLNLAESPFAEKIRQEERKRAADIIRKGIPKTCPVEMDDPNHTRSPEMCAHRVLAENEFMKLADEIEKSP